MNTRDLLNFKPYTMVKRKDNYADVTFQNEGLMTIPLSSASTIIGLLNDAFNNGVKMTLTQTNQNGTVTIDTQPFIPKPMAQEEPQPLNLYKK